MKTVHLTPAVLYRAADRIVGHTNGAFTWENNYRQELYMCLAVSNAAKDEGADVAECLIEFKAILKELGVSTGGDLSQILDRTEVPLVPHIKDRAERHNEWADVAQPVRFMFLEFLALSLE